MSALAWSGDGERLAIGTKTGEAAVLGLPSLLFRAGAASRDFSPQKVAP